MTTDTLVFCTMVYDWYPMGCNNNTILAPIITAQCNDPVIMQQIINYKTQIDIRIKQIVKIVVRPPPHDGGGNGNDTENGNDTNGGNYTEPIFDTCMGGPPGIDGCPPEDGRNETTTLLPIISPPDPCVDNPNAEGCEAPPPPPPPPPIDTDDTDDGDTDTDNSDGGGDSDDSGDNEDSSDDGDGGNEDSGGSSDGGGDSSDDSDSKE
jgi:uncharacterized membrane protein YgcG